MCSECGRNFVARSLLRTTMIGADPGDSDKVLAAGDFTSTDKSSTEPFAEVHKGMAKHANTHASGSLKLFALKPATSRCQVKFATEQKNE